jgi:tRNA-Thr(GGU) m(6)t(6)A37 methyltransferase TsaA
MVDGSSSREGQALWARVTALWEAARRRDRATIESALHPDYVGWDMSAAEPHGRAAAVASVLADSAPLEAYALEPLSVRVHERAVGVVHYRYSATVVSTGSGPVQVTGKWTEVYVVRGGDWVLVAVAGRPDARPEARPPELTIVGRVESPLLDPRLAPRQGDEGAPDAWLVFDPAFGDAIRDLRAGDDVFVLTWLHRADRQTLAVHPRGDPSRPLTGVFSTRSPDRPNPLGLHRVRILAAEPLRLLVRGLEAVHGTPIVDVKPVLGAGGER